MGQTSRYIASNGYAAACQAARPKNLPRELRGIRNRGDSQRLTAENREMILQIHLEPSEVYSRTPSGFLVAHSGLPPMGCRTKAGRISSYAPWMKFPADRWRIPLLYFSSSDQSRFRSGGCRHMRRRVWDRRDSGERQLRRRGYLLRLPSWLRVPHMAKSDSGLTRNSASPAAVARFCPNCYHSLGSATSWQVPGHSSTPASPVRCGGFSRFHRVCCPAPRKTRTGHAQNVHLLQPACRSPIR